MSRATENPVRCLQPDCPAQIPRSKWSMVRAQDEGWFFPRDSDGGWCPDHVPGWVAGWRERKASES